MPIKELWWFRPPLHCASHTPRRYNVKYAFSLHKKMPLRRGQIYYVLVLSDGHGIIPIRVSRAYHMCACVCHMEFTIPEGVRNLKFDMECANLLCFFALVRTRFELSG